MATFSELTTTICIPEFQKHGLPHAHIVARFEGDGPNTPDLMDSWVWAQLPSASIAGGAYEKKC